MKLKERHALLIKNYDTFGILYIFVHYINSMYFCISKFRINA